VRPPDAPRHAEPILRQPDPILRNDPIASAPSSNFNRTAPDSSRPPQMRAPESPPAAEARGAYGPSTSPGAHGAQPSAPTAGPSDGKEARIVAILKDGSDGRSFPLHKDVIDLGRIEGDIVLSDDPYLSPRHARLTRRPESWLLRDLDSVNGVYVRIREPVDLSDGDMLLIGQQVLRFETLPDAELPLGPASLSGVLAFGTPEVPRIARLVQYTTEGIGRDLHYLYRDETVIGRENGDIVFTDDPFLSRRHAAITVDRSARRFVLRDLGSSNGTAMRFRGERTLASGDQFRIGRHLFRFEISRASPAGRA
jgi:pSer/pThr/pTyr-binding forkhead associated (FHA) protein